MSMAEAPVKRSLDNTTVSGEIQGALYLYSQWENSLPFKRSKRSGSLSRSAIVIVCTLGWGVDLRGDGNEAGKPENHGDCI
jgi:hypothetical protein